MRIGFVCSTNTQVQTFLPVSQALQTSENSIVFISLDPFYHWGAEKELVKNSCSFIYVGEISSSKPFTRLGLWQMYTYLLKLKLPIDQLLQTLDILILGNDRGLIEKQFIHQSHQQNVPTLLIQDGLLWRSEVRHIQWQDLTTGMGRKKLAKETLRITLKALALERFAPTYMGQGGCDAIAVMGKGTKNVLVERGISPNKIYITGQPRYDAWIKINQKETLDKFKQRYQLPQNHLIISIFTSAFQLNLGRVDLQTRQEKLVHELVELFSRHSTHTTIILKHHPREDQSGYAAAHENPQVRVIEGTSSFDILLIADKVISAPSTIIGEALMLQKELFIMRINTEDVQSTCYLLGSDNETLREYNDAQQLFSAAVSATMKPTNLEEMNSDILVSRQPATPQTIKLIADLTQKSDRHN
jgi:hypothetical protein